MQNNSLNSPKVGIIMNCHNGEKFLSESINSLLSQTYQNWELIFWDNLSSDKSKEVLKSFSDNRIKYYSSDKFLNLYEARNLAIQKSIGKYICFLDTDDLWTKDKIEKQINFLKENQEYKMVYSNYYILDEKKKIKYKKYTSPLPQGNITKSLLKNYSVGILTTCLEKKIFDKLNFKKEYNIIGDFDFFIKLSQEQKIGCIQKPLAYYRLHETNYSNKKLKLYVNELTGWIKENYSSLKIKGYDLKYQKFYLFKLKIKSFLQFWSL